MLRNIAVGVFALAAAAPCFADVIQCRSKMVGETHDVRFDTETLMLSIKGNQGTTIAGYATLVSSGGRTSRYYLGTDRNAGVDFKIEMKDKPVYWVCTTQNLCFSCDP